MIDSHTPLQQKCGFEWHGRDGKDHRCILIACHVANLHCCDCGERKYGGPDPTAWRRKNLKADAIPLKGTVS